MHKKQSKSIFIESIFMNISNYLKAQKMKNPRFNKYCKKLDEIISFHTENNILYLSVESLTLFMKDIYYKGLFNKRSIRLQVVYIIIEYYSLNIEIVKHEIQELILFNDSFLVYWKKSHSINAIPSIKSTLYHFLLFLYFNKIFKLAHFDEKLLITYFEFIGTINKKITLLDTIQKIRPILQYAYDAHFIKHDYSTILYGIGINKNECLPDHYSISEIKQILKSIDRKNESGKRRYAIVLMISILGIRAIDVSLMKIDNIDWDNNRLNFCQSKTKGNISLHIPTALKNAILDYLSVRKDIESKYLFVHLPKNGLKGKLSSTSISRIVNESFQNSNIDINGRKHHSHVLRHSLACDMINNNVQIETVSEILGHSHYQSTKSYAKISIETMRFLSLEVPDYE